MMNRIKIKVNKMIPPYQVDQIVEVLCDKEGTPLDAFWRRKLRDAKFDQCCEVKVNRPFVPSDKVKGEDE